MDQKPSSILLSPEDVKIVAWLRKALTKDHGKVSFTFIIRQAIRALQQKMRGGPQ
jgi:hypothetical protein